MVKKVEKAKTKEVEASLGVRTRAQALSLNQQKGGSSVVDAITEDTCYLQLRSRRIERLPPTETRNARRKLKGAEKNEEAPIVELNERSSTERVPANNFCAASRFTDVPDGFFDDFFDNRQIDEKFTKKYNFDFANDKPLSGKWEWEEIKP